MKLLPTETFISGNVPLYDLVREYPDLRMVPMAHYDTVKNGLQGLGYRFRIRYRGPKGPCGETYKSRARAFTVYFQEELV